MGEMLSVKNINVFYGSIQALRDISFHVNEGEIVTLIGANGAGKTTTMHAISGLLKVQSGEIDYCGQNISKMEAHKIMGKNIEAKYCPSSHYWAKYPELYGGAYGIKPEILDHEVNKFSLCDNAHAREAYGWVPRVDIETGLSRVVEAECKMLAAL